MRASNDDDQEKKKAVAEIRKNFVEWGIDDADETLRGFRNDIVRIVEDCVDGGGGDGEGTSRMATPQMLSEDIVEAVEAVLRAELEGTRQTYKEVEDIFDNPFPPYWVKPDRFNPGKLYKALIDDFERKTKKGKNLSKRHLDPFVRFSAVVYSKVDYFYKTWIKERNNDAIQGHVMEAIVVSHAIHHKACFHCFSKGSLRWTGGPLGPWTDMICIACDSTFEIKSKRNKEKVLAAHKYGIGGGSYASFHEVIHQPRKAGWKAYVITVSREATYEKVGDEDPCWAVRVAEIERISPCLCDKSFTGQFDLRRSMKSQITPKEIKEYYHIPFVNVNYGEALVKILTEKFPEDVFVDENGNCRRRIDTAAPNKVYAEDEIDGLDQEVDVAAALREALNGDDVPDCWDDSSVEDE